MNYLHSLQPPVIHSDLKTQNVLVSDELEVKVRVMSRYLLHNALRLWGLRSSRTVFRQVIWGWPLPVFRLDRGLGLPSFLFVWCAQTEKYACVSKWRLLWHQQNSKLYKVI